MSKCLHQVYINILLQLILFTIFFIASNIDNKNYTPPFDFGSSIRRGRAKLDTT